jgi:serine/threonine-protein kinase
MPGTLESSSDRKSSAKTIGSERRAAGDALPRRFGRLTLLKQIARGGMGEVFLATAGGIEGAERPCVVKIIRREHADDRSFLARFLDEARIQAQLQHPGVAQVLEASTDSSGKPFVVVEHVEGRNLGEVRTRARQLGVRLGWADAVAIGVALGDALCHVHERLDADGRPLSIVHRDLSPQNVMVGYGGDVKLIDFGTARGENRRCHTVSGVVFAKPGYVAPEVANNQPGGAPADLYAFGIMLWELVAGRRFLSGEASEHLALVAKGERKPTPLSGLVDSPRELDSIIARLTRPSMEERYPSAREAVSDLVLLLKRAPSLADGERGVRARVAHLMGRLYPAEPARSRAEFARLVAGARRSNAPAKTTLPTPSPAPASEADDPALLPGTRYRLVREIGRGGMGVVYEAFHVDLGRIVALKVLPGEHATSARFSERLRAEARAIAKLRHEHLVTLYDFGLSADGRPYYAMELLEGETLETYMDREKGMDWREAVRLTIQGCRALEVAHRAGVVHRDIKPANLYITTAGSLKLLDFGVAKAASDPEASAPRPGALSLVGTPEYMAPEQTAGGSADERSDVYALGAVLYELVTGRLPHVASSTVALIDAKNRTNCEPPRQRAPKRGLPRMLDDAIIRSLERHPEQRFQSAAEFRQVLEEALREPERARRRRRRMGFATVGAMMVALGGLGYTGYQRPEVRARAMAMAQPVLHKVDELRSARQAALHAPVADEAKPAASPAKAAPAPEDKASSPPSAPPPAKPDPAADPANDKPIDVLAQADAPDSAQPSSDSAQPSSDPAQPDALEQRIAASVQLMESGNKLKGYNQLRELGRDNGKDPRALKAWGQAAVEMRAWGEALHVARLWSKVDPGVDSGLNLARMQRRTGHRSDAVRTLAALVKAHPDSDQARSMLGALGGQQRMAEN